MTANVKVDEPLTRRLAELARLELTDGEIAAFTAQLSQILDYVGKLQEVDVTGVEPLLTPIELATPLREDRVEPSRKDASGKPRILASAPETVNDGFKVPQIL